MLLDHNYLASKFNDVVVLPDDILEVQRNAVESIVNFLIGRFIDLSRDEGFVDITDVIQELRLAKTFSVYDFAEDEEKEEKEDEVKEPSAEEKADIEDSKWGKLSNE